MFRLAALLGLIGLFAATGVIAWSGYEDVLHALSMAGWGILITSLYHLVPMLACVVGWRALFPGHRRPSLPFFFYVLWLRSSVNNLLPVARIGGEVVAVRLMTKYGTGKNLAIASTVVELTMSVLAVFLFDIIGISLFAFHVSDKSIVWQLIIGLLLSVPVIGLMLFVQRAGFFQLLDKIFNLLIRDKWKKYAGNAAMLDRAVHTLYRRQGRVLICGLWQFLSWVLGVGEIWLGLHFLGHDIPLLHAFMIEALIQATSSAGFAIPGALGLQEAGFVLFGHMMGLSTDVAAALAIIRRCRDLIIYLPGLIVWQVQEGRWLLRKHKT